MENRKKGVYLCFPSGSDGKESSCNAGDLGLIPGIPWGRVQQPTALYLPRESHGQTSLVGYSHWGCKQSDMTGQLTLSLFTCTKYFKIFMPL